MFLHVYQFYYYWYLVNLMSLNILQNLMHIYYIKGKILLFKIHSVLREIRILPIISRIYGVK